ncbi:hypothetical protein DPMN_070836 [Dreissena polymorpha]|uniref:EF-hand domain-containing protein n=2 Tax=Dreissena polymorpha TaxID=45954 RepID=A0A9D4BP95_DREPO|nr:hypothetical protein DPMN_070834 [Dreissena polymorpha]KAH3711331.1 hypothetical protein DPMN_070836 [Dreissena polymorpha]
MAGMQPSEDEQILEEAFNLFDKDNNGKISISEFGMVLRAVGFNPSDKEVEQFVLQLDKDGSGQLEFKEFRMFYSDYKKKHKNNEQAIANAFKAFDKNGNGYIEAKELKAILHNCGQIISDTEIDEMISVADFNADGKIDYKEFAKFICKPVK